MSQHFLLSAKARTISEVEVARMSEDEAREVFEKLRWSDTDGEPVCSHCGCTESYVINTHTPSGKPVRRYKCKACRKQYTVTSGTIFASHKLELRDYLLATIIFVNAVKGISALQMARALGCQYKTAFVLIHKLRASLMDNQDDAKLAKLFTSFNNTSLSILALPSISTMDDFNKYFNLYEWFYSRRNKHSIYLTDSFKKAIEKSPNINNILTSLLRGVYYPKYNLYHGATSSIHDIEAHRDNNQKVRIKKDKEASFNDTVLYRVYVLPHNKVKEGKIRLGYVIYKEVYIIFCYHINHCDNMTGFKDKKFTLNGTDYTLSIVKST